MQTPFTDQYARAKSADFLLDLETTVTCVPFQERAIANFDMGSLEAASPDSFREEYIRFLSPLVVWFLDNDHVWSGPLVKEHPGASQQAN
jgi:hypothetical protein